MISKKVFAIILILLFVISAFTSGCGLKASSSGNVAAKLELAVKYLSENKFEEAILTYQEVLKIDRKNVMAYKGLCVAYSLQGKPDKAEQVVQDGLKQVTNGAPLKLSLAGLFVDERKTAEAEALYNEIIAGNGRCLPAYRAYSRLLLNEGKNAEAVALLEKAVQANPDNYYSHSILAEMYLANGNREKALDALKESLALEPDQSHAYKVLQDLYRDRWKELVALGEKYADQKEAALGPIIKLIGLFSQGKYEEVTAQYDRLANDIKANAKVQLLVAQAYLKTGWKDRAGDVIKEIETDKIKDPALMAEIADCYLQTGDKESARRLASQGIALDETAVENYIVLYRSCLGENESQAKIWLMKYLLSSLLGLEEAKNELAEAGISLDGEKTQSISKEILYDISGYYLRNFPNKRFSYSDALYCYLDKKRNIAYHTIIFGDPNCSRIFETEKGGLYWKNNQGYLNKTIIFRIHQPKLYSQDFVLNEIAKMPKDRSDEDRGEYVKKMEKYKKEYDQCILEYDEYEMNGFKLNNSPPIYFPVALEGELPFEDLLRQAGISTKSIIFVDIE
ncbi:MAG: tetratricopeptide repeat protein [Bacillota bacterium]